MALLRPPRTTRETAPALGDGFLAPRIIAGEYDVLAVLGRSRTAVVYRAFSCSLATEVAVKVPAPWAHRRAHAAIRQEATLLQGLDHPNVVPLIETGREGDMPYLVMPLAPLGSLRSTLERAGGALPAPWVAQVIGLTAEGLQAVHDRGLVHLDVKPGNILLGEGDWPWLADFSTATRAAAPRQGARPWRLPGTEAYMAPEHRAGRAVDARADQYALGLVAWEALSGRRPERATLDEAGRVFPAPIATVLARACAFDPDHRYPSARAFAAALASALAVAAPGDPARRRWRLAATAASLPAAGALAALCVTVGPRPLVWDWAWALLGLVVLVLARAVLLATPSSLRERALGALLSATLPRGGAEDDRRRAGAALSALLDAALGVPGGVLLLSLLLAVVGASASEARAALLAGAVASAGWLALAARLVWLGGKAALPAAVLLACAALPVLAAPAAVAHGALDAVNVLGAGLALQLLVAWAAARGHLVPGVRSLLGRWLDVALAVGSPARPGAQVRRRRRAYEAAAVEGLDLTAAVVLAGAVLAPTLRWALPALPWAWATALALAALLPVWALWGYRLWCARGDAAGGG